ncbi:MAG: zf-HC2 domain-containing protein [Gemmatimonadales bacterium]
MMNDALSCQETFRRLNDYVDRELTQDEQGLVEAHLAECTKCASVFGFEESLLLELKAKLNRIQLPPALKQRVAEALERGAQARDA